MKPKFTGTEKQCIKCSFVFPMEDFYMAKDTKIYSARCKRCDLIDHNARFNKSYKTRASILIHTAKSSCKRRNILFGITKEDVIKQYEKQDGKCYYSGIELSFQRNNSNIMSIDRKDSKLGYTPENIVLCCWAINRMKNKSSLDEFLYLCHSISDYSKLHNIN